MPTLEWVRLLNNQRFSDLLGVKTKPTIENPEWFVDSRTEIERDYDRVLFSSPVRRLGDKTQVFPLEKIESVRTRLTHSHEVANIARSIGTYLANNFLRKIDVPNVARDIPAMLAAVGLAHDLGNPPFGHQGENAIQAWIRRNEKRLFEPEDGHLKYFPEKEQEALRKDLEGFTKDLRLDFLNFEGNAQTLRVITRLQVVKNDLGLNLTFGTLGALMKYSVPAHEVRPGDGRQASKKFGFFASEKAIVDTIWNKTGLSHGLRHPLTTIVEACDDLAYSVLDTEDAVKKQLVSFHDLMAWLSSYKDAANDELCKWVRVRSLADHEAHQKTMLSPSEVNDVSMQKFRVYAIQGLVAAVISAFEKNFDNIMEGDFEKNLLECSAGGRLCEALKMFDLEHAYRHRSVLEIELDGYNVIHELMDLLWRGITERKEYNKLDSARLNPFAAYTYGRISENYRRVFANKIDKIRDNDPDLPVRYLEVQLLTDMMSGMADNFALDLAKDLKRYNVGPSRADT